MLRAATQRKARALVAGSSLLCAWCGPRLAVAGGPLGNQGQPIQTSDYKLDLFQGPVLASSRVTGMGGAYSALAEGAEGLPFNAAGASLRYPYSTRRLDYDVTASITLPASVEHTDFDNNGDRGFRYDNFFWATVGGLLQYDHWGFGADVSMQSYTIGQPRDLGAEKSGVDELTLRVFKVDALVSYGFLDDQLHLGGGIRGAVFTAVDTSPEVEQLLLGTYGVGAQGGALWTPHRLPFRLGATVRSPVLGSIEAAPHVTSDDTGNHVGAFYLPSGVDLPWEAEWGVAVQLGPRPLNIPWTDEKSLSGPEVESERRTIPAHGKEPQHLEPANKAARRILRRGYRAIVRDKLLLSFSMLVTGDAPNAVGVESMLKQQVDRSGEKTSVTMRAGGEAELVPNRLQIRAGSYMEPTRFRQSSSRLHGTTGFELRVLEWDVSGLYPEDNAFRISAAVDVARDYFGWSFGIGTWY